MRRLLTTVLSIVALLATAANVAGAAARPELDASALAPAPPAVTQRLAALARDAQLARVATPASTDARYGVPSFLWATRTGPPPSRLHAGAARRDFPALAREHAARLAGFYGLAPADVRGLTLRHVHDTGRGAVIAAFIQTVDGVEVFRDELKLSLDRDGQLISASGYVPPAAMAGDAASRAFRLPIAEAAGIAVRDLAGVADGVLLLRATGARPGGFQGFELATGATAALTLSEPMRAKPVYFHVPEALIPAYHVEVVAGDEAYAYVVSAADGALLYRHSLIESDANTYRVWAEPDGARLPLDGPQGTAFAPHPTGLPDGSKPPYVASSLVTLEHGPISTADPWLEPGATETNGNNVDAYADVNPQDGFTAGDFRAATSGPNAFDYRFDLRRPPNADTQQQMAAITQLFYTINFMHDWYYDAGFTEAAGNAQVHNYGRGGVEGDAIRGEAQDFGGTTNANMLTPSDGGRPRMQMYLWAPARAQLVVRSPAAIAGTYPAGLATAMGPQTFCITAPLLTVNDDTLRTTDGCETILTNVCGGIVLLDRGPCFNLTQAQNAARAGALAAIIVNNTPEPFDMTTIGEVGIPVSSVSSVLGDSLKAELKRGPFSVTLQRLDLMNDGALDNTIVAHEWAHYLSTRLVGNTAGLTTNMARALGEGWSDFHALLLTAREGDDPDGTYAVGGYAYHGGAGAPSDAWYYGLRRVPYSTQLAKNALTFQHIATGVPLPSGPPTAFGADGAGNALAHQAGEVWCTMLWECYAALLKDRARLSFAEAQSRMKDYLVAAYQMTPNQPTLTEARDALLAAAYANDPADLELFWQAFAKRGAGVGAVAPPRFASDNAGVTESFEYPGALTVTAATVTDDVTSCDHDGYLDAGESGTLTVTLRNSGGSTLSGAVVHVASANPDLSFPAGTAFELPTTAAYASGSVQIPVSLGASAAFGTTALEVTTSNPALAGGAAFAFDTWVAANEQPSSTFETMDALSATWAFPSDTASRATPWSRAQFGATDWRFAAPAHTLVGDVRLVSPPLQVGDGGPLRVVFDHAYAFQANGGRFFDGGVIEISTDDGATWSDAGAGLTPPYPATLSVIAHNPLGGRPAFSGTSPGYPAATTQTLDLGTAYAGQTVRLRFRLGSDSQIIGGAGWNMSQIQFEQVTNQPFRLVVAQTDSCADESEDPDRPADVVFALSGANPVRGAAEFRFALPAATHVSVTIHDLAGRRVATVLDGELSAGRHNITWSRGAGSGGDGIPAGVYFARLATKSRTIVTRVVVLR